jgi:hypothetical protein
MIFNVVICATYEELRYVLPSVAIMLVVRNNLSYYSPVQGSLLTVGLRWLYHR